MSLIESGPESVVSESTTFCVELKKDKNAKINIKLAANDNKNTTCLLVSLLKLSKLLSDRSEVLVIS